MKITAEKSTTENVTLKAIKIKQTEKLFVEQPIWFTKGELLVNLCYLI